jgi:hypothetical protein
MDYDAKLLYRIVGYCSSAALTADLDLRVAAELLIYDELY